MSLAAKLVSQTYYEVFIEKIAEVVAVFLTDKESEAIISGFKNISEKFKEKSRLVESRVAMRLQAAPCPLPGNELMHIPSCSAKT
jgi:hypothetical protein